MPTHNTLKALALRLGRKYNTLYRQAQALGIEPVETIGNVQIISDADAQRLADYDKKPGPEPRFTREQQIARCVASPATKGTPKYNDIVESEVDFLSRH